MNLIGAVMFIVGIICIALGVTYFPFSELLLAGIIIAGGSLAFSTLFRES